MLWSSDRDENEVKVLRQQFDDMCCQLIRLLVDAGASRSERPPSESVERELTLVETMFACGASCSVVRCLLSHPEPRTETTVRRYWATDDVASMLHAADNDGFTTLHRAYLTQMLSLEPNPGYLTELLMAGADPSALNAAGDTPDRSSADHPAVLERFANGYHQYGAPAADRLLVCTAKFV